MYNGEVIASESSTHHGLYDKWTLWAHLPHDTDWTLKAIKESVTLILWNRRSPTETLPEKLIKNCMLFIMRNGIQPTWEDEKNASSWLFFI